MAAAIDALENKDPNEPELNWGLKLDNFPTIPEFTGNSGLHIDTDEYSALSCFQLFIDEIILKTLKTHQQLCSSTTCNKTS